MNSIDKLKKKLRKMDTPTMQLLGMLTAFLSPFFFILAASLVQDYKYQKKLLYIEKSRQVTLDLCKKLLDSSDINQNHLLEDNEKGSLLTKMGYEGVVQGDVRFGVYDPCFPESYYFERSDIFRRGNTIYIPVENAKKLLEN